MSRFLQYAAEILDTVETSLAAGHSPSPMAILIGARGGLRLVADAGWSLDQLRAEHGADLAYRVTGHAGKAVVEGRQGLNSVRLETTGRECTAAEMLRPALPACYLLEASGGWNRRLPAALS